MDDKIFETAHTYHKWIHKDISDEDLKKIYDLMKWGPTSANCCPLRIIFIKSKQAKEILKQTLNIQNVEKTMTAPVTAIFGYDLDFASHLDFLFPHVDAKPWFKDPEVCQFTAFLNSALQAAYFIIAARMLGFDCGPMSGFSNTKVDELFFKGTKIKSLFLCNIGHGDKSSLYPRSPRFNFEDIAQIK